MYILLIFVWTEIAILNVMVGWAIVITILDTVRFPNMDHLDWVLKRGIYKNGRTI